MMNARRIVIGALALATALALTAGWAQARAPAEEGRADMRPRPAFDLVAGSIPIQGRLTDASGAPLTGSYNVSYRLYGSVSGGTVLCLFTRTGLSVTGGLFSDTIDGCAAGIFDGRGLWLGIQVSPDAEMTPLQPIYPVPYAMSLKPGALVNSLGGSVPGLTLKSDGVGGSRSALRTENTATGAGGIALWAVAKGTDASVVIENTSTGPLLKGFGGDGGEDELRLGNDGSIQSKADSYVFVPGTAFVQGSDSVTTGWSVNIFGGVHLWRGSAPNTQAVFYPIVLPAVLYGQPVEIESMTVYYMCDNGANNYIDSTWLIKQTAADSNQVLINDTTHRTSTTAASYTLTPGAGNVLSSNAGIVVAELGLHFTDDVNAIAIGGLRLRLHHHSLPDD